MKRNLFILSCAATLMFSACSNNEQQNASQESPTTAAAPAETATTGDITLTTGDDMKFSLTTIKVKAGQPVKLTLSHLGKMPKAAMGHNFVLLAQGVSLGEFASKAMLAKDTDYIPAGSEKEVIAHTKLIGGGESDTIEFTAPAKGTYEYFCSFPGHSSMMRGTFIVE